MAQLLFHNPAPVTCLHVSSPTKNHKEGIMLNFFCLPGSPCPARVPRSGPRVPLSCPPGSPSPTRVLPPGPPVLPPGSPGPAPRVPRSCPPVTPVLPGSPGPAPQSPGPARVPRSDPGPPVLPGPPGPAPRSPGPAPRDGTVPPWPGEPRLLAAHCTSSLSWCIPATCPGTSRDQPRPRNI